MARKTLKNEAHVVKKIIAKIIDDHFFDSEELDGIELPYIGDNISNIMADAALAVLLGMADAEEYLRDNGLLTND